MDSFHFERNYNILIPCPLKAKKIIQSSEHCTTQNWMCLKRIFSALEPWILLLLRLTWWLYNIDLKSNFEAPVDIGEQNASLETIQRPVTVKRGLKSQMHTVCTDVQWSAGSREPVSVKDNAFLLVF